MAWLRSIRHPLHRFTQVDGRRRLLVIEAIIWLWLARTALRLVPFPRLAQRLGTFATPEVARATAAKNPRSSDDVRVASDIGWAVTRAARHVPFAAVCLPQAMAARVMLKRRGVASILHFGAAKAKDQTLDTHAWLDAAGIEVTGYPVAKSFTEIACYV
ncbi:MAG: lasso peptide biosynthesis B2 protein [Rhodopseudomonas sp.]|nr:lasso peptide biosynthesis B2 protein [Rhodopseudomonas sp.]